MNVLLSSVVDIGLPISKSIDCVQRQTGAVHIQIEIYLFQTNGILLKSTSNLVRRGHCVCCLCRWLCARSIDFRTKCHCVWAQSQLTSALHVDDVNITYKCSICRKQNACQPLAILSAIGWSGGWGVFHEWNHYVWIVSIEWVSDDGVHACASVHGQWWSCLNRIKCKLWAINRSELTSRQNFLHVSLDRWTAIPSAIFEMIFAFAKSHADASGDFIHQRCVSFAYVVQFATQTSRFFAYQMRIK